LVTVGEIGGRADDSETAPRAHRYCNHVLGEAPAGTDAGIEPRCHDIHQPVVADDLQPDLRIGRQKPAHYGLDHQLGRERCERSLVSRNLLIATQWRPISLAVSRGTVTSRNLPGVAMATLTGRVSEMIQRRPCAIPLHHSHRALHDLIGRLLLLIAQNGVKRLHGRLYCAQGVEVQRHVLFHHIEPLR
jgi:hypothetical protein